MMLRILAGLAGLVALICGIVFTLGFSVAGMIGILAVWLYARHRVKPTGLMQSWIGAVIGVAIVMTILGGVAFLSLPEGAISEAIATVEAAEAAEPQPMPEWLERLAPPTNQPALADQIVGSKAFNVYFGLMGVSITLLMLSAYAGTIGWGSVMLVGYAALGRWPLRAR